MIDFDWDEEVMHSDEEALQQEDSNIVSTEVMVAIGVVVIVGGVFIAGHYLDALYLYKRTLICG